MQTNNNDEESEDEYDKPYFDDAIDKYYDRPNNEIFKNITYPEYFKNYNITTKPPGINSKLYTTQDSKNRFVTKIKKPLLLRFTHYKVDDGKPFFFQHLIMKIPVYSQSELLGNYTNFRERFQNKYPVRYQQILNKLSNSSLITKTALSDAFKKTIESVLENLDKSELWNIIYNQLILLEKPSLTSISTLTLDEEQYEIYNILCNSWGSEQENKYPYFFMTGSAGTGKSFMIHHITNMLESKNIKYILLFSTGVSTQNIGGKTIHSALKIRQYNDHY